MKYETFVHAFHNSFLNKKLSQFKVGHSPSKKDFLFALIVALQNWWKIYFILKALFVLKIFRLLSWLFGHVEKTTWLEGQG